MTGSREKSRLFLFNQIPNHMEVYRKNNALIAMSKGIGAASIGGAWVRWHYESTHGKRMIKHDVILAD